jgi:chromosome partitioning protein
MLDWLKRKGPPPATEPALESPGQKPLTDERLGRLLGRLGPNSEPAVRVRIEPVSEVPNTVEPAPSEPAAEASPIRGAPPRTESGADARFTLRREDLTITNRSGGPSVAELLAKGYSFATGPDGKMVVFDTEGNVTDMTPPRPSTARSGVGEPAAAVPEAVEAVQETEPSPSGDDSAVSEPAVAEPMQATEPPPSGDDGAASELPSEAPQETDSPAQAGGGEVEEAAAEAPQEPPAPLPTDRKKAKKPAADALQEVPALPQAERKRMRKPAASPSSGTDRAPAFDRKTPEDRGGGLSGMYVIAVSSQKGGSGKTTIAAHLAVAAAAADVGPVVLIDTDPQGSLAEWWQARAAETPQLATVKPEALAANLAELRSYGTAIAIVDTPPALTGSIEHVIAMADLIIIPARPSPHDLRAASGTVEMARKAGKPFMFVVNGASPRASITAQAVAALSEHGRVAPVILYQRTEYAASMIDGRTVLETAGSGRSAQEIAELWQCVYAQIGLRVAA